jgi:hypothetical protein
MTRRTIVIELARLEAAHLADLVARFDELLSDSAAHNGDPAVERLAPPAYENDADAREFRALTRGDLLERRRSDAGIVLASLGEAGADAHGPGSSSAPDTVSIRLDDATARAWLRTLAAVRLVLATRLGIEAAGDDDSDDPRFGIYHWLGYRLDGLVSAIEDSA